MSGTRSAGWSGLEAAGPEARVLSGEVSAEAAPDVARSAPGRLRSAGIRSRLRLTRLLRQWRQRRPTGASLLLYASMPALSGVNALVGLVLPALLGPAAFGEYSLAVTLFQYGLIFDLGISQAIDRDVPVLLAKQPEAVAPFVAQAMGVRLYVAAATMAVGTATLVALSVSDRLPFRLLDGLLSLGAGLCLMIALGPMAVWRAQSRRQAFAVSSALCNLALAIARPLGIILGGITGCFGALLACYAALAATLPRGLARPRCALPSVRQTAGLVGYGLPLFLTSILWAVYMTANRWVVSFLAEPVELGHFAFGANVLSLLVGTIAALAQLYYPAATSRVAAGGGFAISRKLTRDLAGLGLCSAALAVAGIVAGPYAMQLGYRSFADSVAPMRILLIDLPTLVVSSWLMPLALATAGRPWVDSLLTFPAALLLLVATTWLGYRLGGIEGAAWGSSAGGPILLLLQLAVARANRLLSSRHAGLLFVLLGVVGGALALLAG